MWSGPSDGYPPFTTCHGHGDTKQVKTVTPRGAARRNKNSSKQPNTPKAGWPGGALAIFFVDPSYGKIMNCPVWAPCQRNGGTHLGTQGRPRRFPRRLQGPSGTHFGSFWTSCWEEIRPQNEKKRREEKRRQERREKREERRKKREERREKREARREAREESRE